MLCKNCAKEPLIFLPNRNILHPLPSAKGSNSQCDLHGEFRGVFRTTSNNEAFLQKKLSITDVSLGSEYASEFYILILYVDSSVNMIHYLTLTIKIHDSAVTQDDVNV